MAKQIEELLIRLGIDGYEDIAKLKSAFRSLEGTVKESDDVIERARKSLLDYGRSSNQTQDLLRGMVTSLNALKAKANENGEAYRKLQRDQKRYAEQLYGATDAIVKQRDALVQNAKAVQTSSASVYRYITSLKKLRAEVRDGTAAAAEFDKEIAALSQRMQELRRAEPLPFVQAFKTAKEGAQGLVGTIQGVGNATQTVAQRLITLGRQSRTALGAAMRTAEGIGTAAAGVVIGGGATSAAKGVLGAQIAQATAMSNLLSGIQAKTQAIPGLRNLVSPEQIANLQNTVDRFTALQAKVGVLDTALHTASQSMAALGPAGAAAATAATVGMAALAAHVNQVTSQVAREVEKDFEAVSDETQKLLENLVRIGDYLQKLPVSRIRELLGERQELFAQTPAGSALSRAQASQIAGLESVLRQELATQAVTLEEYRSRVRGSSQSLEDLGERMSFVQSRMKVLDTSTADGAREFGALKQEAMSLTAQMEALASSYAHVSTRAVEARTAQENAANAAMRGAYLNTPTTRYRPSSADLALQELRMRMMAGAQAMGTTQPIPGRTPGRTLALPAAGGTSAAGTGLERSGGAKPRIGSRGQVEYTFNAPIDVGDKQVPNYMRDPRYMALRGLKTTAAVGAPPAVGYSRTDPSLQRAIPAYKEAQQELAKVLLSSDNTIKSLNAQRGAWNRLRDAIDPASSTFANATKRIQALDEKLEGLSAKQAKVATKPRMGARQYAEVAGAALSGGVFGGPEGFLGGVVGGAVGGVGGAFAGAAIGAQVAAFRQAAGGAAEYAAAINQQRRALEGVVADSTAYQQSLAFIDQTSRQLAIPQEQITTQFTRLSASVIGAGGNVDLAKEAFNGIAAGIRATGGSLADMDAAMLATAQVFSKGKVSAEELRGQIGERLPGAFTLFAESIGKTPQQLDKMLDKGEVGLNDFMAFVRKLNTEYGQTALQMAASSEAAGDRLATAWGRMREEIGKALQPVGAEFQETLARVVSENETQIVELAKGLAGATKAFLDLAIAVGPTLLKLGEFGLKLGATHLLIKGFIALRPGLVALFAAVQLGGAQAAAAAAAASPKVAALATALRSLLRIGVITIGIDIVIRGIDSFMRLKSELQGLRDYNPQKVFEGATRDTVQGAIDQARRDLTKYKKELADLNARWWQTLIPGSALFGASATDFYTEKKKLETRVQRAEATLRGLDPSAYPTAPAGSSTGLETPFPSATDTAGATERARAASDEAARLAAEQQRLDEALMRQGIELDDLRFRNKMDLVRREYELRRELEQRERDLWANTFRGRGAESARALTDFLRQGEERTARFNEMEAELRLRRQELISAQRMERVTSQGISGAPVASGGTAGAPAAGGSQTRALVAAAQKLGVNPLDLATIIGFETGGTYNPSQWGGHRGQHMGLIQFGPNERKAYGAYEGQSFEEQITGPVVRYLQDRFRGVGMSTQGADLLTLYRTVLGGNPKADLSFRDSNKTTPVSGVAAMGPHRTKALQRFFGGDVANVPGAIGAPGGATQIRRDVGAEGAVAQAKEQVAQQEKLIALERKKAEEAAKLDRAEYIQKATKAVDDQTAALEDNFEIDKAKAQLEESGVRTEFVEMQVELLRLYQEQAMVLAPLLEAQKTLTDPTQLEAVNESIKKINDAYQKQSDILFKQTQAQTQRGAALRRYLGQQRRELDQMTDIEQVVIQGAQVIEQEMSSAMAAAVTSVVTGSGSIKEALGNAFEAIGQAFIKMATDIIAKQLIMITLQAILKALGGATGGPNMGAVGSYADTSTSLTMGAFPSAKGNAFSPQGHLERYAKGGIVSSPTMFRFAKGGGFAPGLMGEAGPEAILPLQRGPDGRLGVSIYDASRRAVASAENAAAANAAGYADEGMELGGGMTSADRRASLAATSAAAVATRTQVTQQQLISEKRAELREFQQMLAQPARLDVEFKSQVINNVEYVTKEQAERMAAQSAVRGREMTLNALQTSVKTRKRVGMGR